MTRDEFLNLWFEAPRGSEAADKTQPDEKLEAMKFELVNGEIPDLADNSSARLFAEDSGVGFLLLNPD